jgi:hypothetical protein
MIEAARTSETSVDIQLRTWQYISEDSELQLQLYLYLRFSYDTTAHVEPLLYSRFLITHN